MSNSHLFMVSGFPRAPLQNGIGRYVCQLKRITLKFCKSNGDSKGFREFLETELVNFANKNPGVVVYVKPRRHRAPTLTAEYLNGQKDYINCHNFSKEEVYKWINLFTQRSGKEVMRYRKNWQTNNPSIQGIWTPTKFRDPKLNLTVFPIEGLNGPKNPKPTATQLLLEMFEKEKNEKSMNAQWEAEGLQTQGEYSVDYVEDTKKKTFS
ncbi:39S ribosomal protein L43, mitochondrial [Cimex lectularius]|uniref:Large ribosomal subunit protein mL43 n=1 Tax=Cimex lectularius TaxID=79782 RepID=A0A8I6RLP3_CIMLE|nr:39S ribosomal protein L43, mitochondrial [Cimex lectularius]